VDREITQPAAFPLPFSKYPQLVSVYHLDAPKKGNESRSSIHPKQTNKEYIPKINHVLWIFYPNGILRAILKGCVCGPDTIHLTLPLGGCELSMQKTMIWKHLFGFVETFGIWPEHTSLLFVYTIGWCWAMKLFVSGVLYGKKSRFPSFVFCFLGWSGGESTFNTVRNGFMRVASIWRWERHWVGVFSHT